MPSTSPGTAILNIAEEAETKINQKIDKAFTCLARCRCHSGGSGGLDLELLAQVEEPVHPCEAGSGEDGGDDERVHLRGGEKGLSRLDGPHDGATIVLRSGIPGASKDLIDSTV